MKRIQRKRTKGWKLPENTFCVNRGTKWGNPIKLVGDQIFIDASYRRKVFERWVFLSLGDIDDVIFLYKRLWDGTKFQNPDLQHWSDEFKKLDVLELKGKNLACFCDLDSPCHADVLLERANQINK